MVAAPFSTVAYTKLGPKFVITSMALLPAIMLPMIWTFAEQKNLPVKSTGDQCQEIWSTVKSRAVWQPLGFVSFSDMYTYLYSRKFCFHLSSLFETSVK